MRRVLIILSAVAILLGSLLLISTLSSPSLDLAILARDLGLSIAAVALGLTAPLLLHKFSRNN
ncbi:MAG: hypothetical protein QXD96_07375 [Pyrobaculum sp.]